MKTRIITTIALSIVTLSAAAQQDIAFSQYFFNPMYVNPAYAGSRGTFSGTAVYRTQWVGMQGAPVTELLGISDMLPNSNIGLGLQAYNDNVGPLTTTDVSAIFAYHLHLGQSTRLAFGLEGCMDNLNINYNKVSIANPEDPSFTGITSSAWVPDANAGLYLYNENYFAGFSVKHLMEPSFGSLDTYGSNAKLYRSYFLTAGFVAPLSDNIGIRPSALIKYVPASPADLDLDASLIFCKRFYIGAGIRTDKRINISGMDNIFVATVEFDVANLIRIGYSYDYYLSQNGPSIYGTHEIMLGWDIFYTKTKMESPKYF